MEPLADTFDALRILPGDTVLLHVPARGSLAALEARRFVRALARAVGPDGTVLAPEFLPYHAYAGDGEPDPDARETVQVVSREVASMVNAARSGHPSFSFVAAGRNASYLTENAPFHFPLGTSSPVARLHQLNGVVLLLEAGQESNTALHLAENYADVPYQQRSRLVSEGEDSWAEMRGSPECSAGFGRIEPLLRQARITRQAEVRGMRVQAMRAQPAVSLAVAMLQGDAESLLCQDPYCRACATARKFTAKQG